jgi:Domain of unknown function (DUF4399)
MKKRDWVGVMVVLAGSVVVAATAAAQAKPAAASAVKVHITSPKQDAVITGANVQVTLTAEGIEIAPVAEHKAGTAHHHLFLDTEVTPADAPIPVGVAGITHLGKGQTEYTLQVAPGAHRLIAVLADPDHVPLKPLVADTVRFTVKP